MRFVDDTPVITIDEEKVGQIDRVVIDPSSQEVSHLIIEKGFFFPEDKIVPISLIAEANAKRVILKKTKDQLDLQPFEETEYVPTEAIKQVKDDMDIHTYRRSYYPYPAAGVAPTWSTGWFYSPAFPSSTAKVTGRNIPEDAIALKEGAKVHSSDNKHVGEIESVLTEDENHRVTHFVVSQGLFFEEYKLIPAFWISRTEEDHVYLGVDSKILNNLPDYSLEEGAR